MANRNPETYGRTARNRLHEAGAPGPEGARAAVETFYHAFNRRSLELLSDVWVDDPLVRLNNPLGGIVEGRAGIRELYSRIFAGPARVWVELHDVVE
ncbi:MAG: nuclear transport factor 2 family protein [Mycobacteriales bacterium]